MMIGHIYINGIIGSYKDEVGVELIDIISQVQKQRDAEEFIVHINSKGGDIDKGYDIYNYLKSLPQIITTEINGMCASMATVIALAGDKRVMVEGSQFMIHNPWAADVNGDSDELLAIHEIMRVEEDKMIAFYSDHTGILKEGLDALMKAETYLTPEKALELGFITEIRKAQEVKALAFKKEEVKKETSMSKEISNKIDQLMAFLKIKPEVKVTGKALEASDSNGAKVTITKADGSDLEGLPVAGDLIMVDGQLANGSIVIPEMKITIEAAEGVIKSVKEDAVEEAANPELEQAKQDLVASQAKVKDLEDKVKEHESFKAEVENKFALIEKGLKASHSNYVPQGRAASFDKGKEVSTGFTSKEDLKKRREELRNKKN